MIDRIIEALQRCKLFALSIFLTYSCPAALASSWRMQETRSPSRSVTGSFRKPLHLTKHPSRIDPATMPRR
jgi:hypothetical protein